METVVVTYKNLLWNVIKVWDGGYYDLETVNKTELGIHEIELSVEKCELNEQGNKL